MYYKKSHPLIMCLLLALTSIAHGSGFNHKDTLNLRDQNNEKQGHWVIYNENGKYKGYEEGQLVEEGEYLNNKKSGIWTKYYPNGNVKHELTFANNVANGYAKIFYRSGQLQEEGVWKVNRWIGGYKYYYEEGNLQYEWGYNSSGKREGQQMYYHENGVVKYIGDWANGQEAGELREYYTDGSVKAVRQFNNGKVQPMATVNHIQGKEFDGNERKYSGIGEPKAMAIGYLVDGFNRIMNADGTVSKEGEFKNKKLVNGKVYVYENGQIVKTIFYVGGTRSGEEIVE